MSKRIVSAVVPCVCFLFFTAVCSAELAPREFESWKACKVGTMIRVEEKDSAHPDRARYSTVRLVALTATEASVEEIYGETTPNGKQESKPTVRRVLPAEPVVHSTTQPAAKPASTTQPVTEGDEVLDVAGRKVHAHWRKQSRGADVTETLWTSDEIPGGIVMMQEVEKQADSSRERTWKVVEITVP